MLNNHSYNPFISQSETILGYDFTLRESTMAMENPLENEAFLMGKSPYVQGYKSSIYHGINGRGE